MRKKLSIGWVIFAIILGALIGSVLGEIIALVLPDGIVKDFFLRSAAFGFSPTEINFLIIKLTIGLAIKLNIIGVIGIIVAAYIFRWYM